MYAWSDFEQIGRKCDLTEPQMNELAPFYRTLNTEQFDQWSALFEQGKLDAKVLAEVYNQPELRRLQLLLALSLYPEGRKKFAERGWPVTIFDNTVVDVAIWVKHHQDNFGYVGMEWRIAGWYRSMFLGQTVRFGRLQCNTQHNFHGEFSVYRHRTSGELKYPLATSPGNDWECVLKHDDPTINIHIPASGPMLVEDCKASIKEMLAFFRKYQPEVGIKAAVCYSWLLDRQLQQILKPTSNIIAFQQMGHLFDFSEGSGDHQETIWRIFGEKGKNEGVNAVPHLTDMQKRIAAFVNNGGIFSSGGIFILPEEIDSW